MSKKIIIIGGGVAGLSAGIYGQMNGYETEIIEMHSSTGGQCTAWERKGYRFDYCLHWLVGTARGFFNDIWKETHVLTDKTTIIDHDIHSRFIDDKGEDLIIYSNIDRWEKYLLGIAPEDSIGIKKMCNDMRKSTLLENIMIKQKNKSVIKSILSFFRMIPLYLIFIRYNRKNCNQYFKELKFKNPGLSYFFNKSFAYTDFSALAFIMMLSWFNQKNAGYIIGGSLPLARRMTDRYLSLGGKLTTKKKVTKIIVENDIANGIVLSDGMILKGDYIISAADGYNTIFNMLEGKYISKQLKNAYEKWELFTPIVQVSFGITEDIKTEYNNQNYVTETKKIGSTKLDQGYAIMNYCFDNIMAPEGKTVFVLRYQSPWKIWENLSEETYEVEKERIKKDATALFEFHYPGIVSKIEVTDVATPLTDVKYTGVYKGAYEGFMPSAGNLGKSLKNTLPGLNNFYMAGQWLSPGGGLPPSAQSGKKVIEQLCKKDKMKFLVTN